jgi:TPR repeat protein
MYYEGEGVAKNNEKAFYWISKAAKQGSAPAMTSIGSMYYLGEGRQQDLKKAFELYEQAAQKGNELAEARLSCYDENINTLQQHFSKCLELAKQGNVKALFAVGSAYYNGYGIEKDIAKSLWCFSKAAEQDPRYEKAKREVQKELEEQK